MTAPTLHLMCGKIASGKSTLAKTLVDDHAAILLSEDQWLLKLYPGEIHSVTDYVRCAHRIRGVLGPLVVSMLAAGICVVLDFPANAPVDSWDLIFKEENISKLKQCGVALLDSPSEILPLALQHLGLDPNSKKPADYDKAEALLMKIRPYITYFHSSKYMADIANGDICVAVGYSGSFSQAANRAKEAKNGVIVDMRLPKEGAPIWFDMLAIPKGAKDPEDAYTFINYLLQPKVIAPVSDFVGYPNPNKDATELVDPAIRNNPNLYPTEEMMAKLYTLTPLPHEAERARPRAWTKIKSGT